MRITTAEQFKKAREKQKLTKTDTAALLQLPRPSITGYAQITRWEETGSIPGPALTAMEFLAKGQRPDWWSNKK